MKRVLEVSCNGMYNGGVQHVIMEITRNLSRKYNIDVLVFTKGPDYFDKEFQSYGGKIFRLPDKQNKLRKITWYFDGLRIYRGTLKILRENGPYDVIHCHNYFKSAYCLMAAKKAGVPVRIVHSHNDFSNVSYFFTRKILWFIERRIMNRYSTDRIGCSRAAADFLFGRNVSSDVIYNGIDIRRFDDNNDLAPYIANTRIRLLHVGNFSPQKNQLLLADIGNALKCLNIDFVMTLVGGDSEYKNEVQSRVSELGLNDKFVFLPQNSDIPELMGESDLFLFPSAYEGLGIVVIEAQASGLHCIVSKAVPEEADLGNIEYIDSKDPMVWAKKIEQKVKSGQERVYVNMDSYDISKVITNYEKIYENNCKR